MDGIRSGGLKNVRSQLAGMRRACRLLGAAASRAHDVFEGDHRWNGVRTSLRTADP